MKKDTVYYLDVFVFSLHKGVCGQGVSGDSVCVELFSTSFTTATALEEQLDTLFLLARYERAQIDSIAKPLPYTSNSLEKRIAPLDKLF